MKRLRVGQFVSIVSLGLSLSLSLSHVAVAAGVPSQFQKCSVDADCQTIALNCTCCQTGAINKKFREEYANGEKCAQAAPPCSCEKTPAVAKCIRSLCLVK